LPGGAKFCLECGKPFVEAPKPEPQPDPRSYTPPHLAERILAERVAMEARGAAEGERKTITALFADIKGSVELMEDLDPEEARRIVDPALQLMMDAVHRYEGYVAQSRGDGILALFGAPLAHEDHPQRALHSALRMQDEIKRYAEWLRREKGVTLEIRVGVNTGEVVVRSIRKDDLHTDYVPIGHSTNLAARLESLATPGSILASEETRKLTEGYFEFESLGAARVKGVSEAVELFQLVGLGQLRTKLEVSAKRGLAKFVGRETEMAALGQLLELARKGRGQIVGVVGEPGVGKSRLCHEFKIRYQRDARALEVFAVSHGKGSPYLPIIEMLRSYFEIGLGDDEIQQREKISGRVLTLDHSLEDTLPYLFSLLGILEDTSPLAQMAPQIRRQRVLKALKRLVLREARDRPLLLLVEDLHWIDGETEAFLTTLGDSLATGKLLLLVNYRPEYQQPWGRRGYVEELRLDPLEKKSADEMLKAMLGDAEELKPLKMLILEKSEGTPFFLEEIVQGLFDSGILKRNGKLTLTKSVSEIQIPTTVEGVLAARLDRLKPQEKELVQTAAVIGREFTLGLLEKTTGETEIQLREVLRSLQAVELVYEQPASADPGYIFKHALTRDVAYQSLLKSRRQQLHQQVAQVVEQQFPETVETQPELVAHHYTAAGLIEQAIPYWERAGQRAIERGANAEAVNHLTTGLGLVKTLQETPPRARQELTLQLAVGALSIATHGFAAPEVEYAYRRARELCQQIGEKKHVVPALVGMVHYHAMRAEHKAARELAEELYRVAQEAEDPDLLIEAHHLQGNTLEWTGEFRAALTHLERGIALYDPKRHRSHAVLYGTDPGVACRLHAMQILWLLGYPDHALERARETLALSQGLSHANSVAYGLIGMAQVHHHRREWPAAEERAEANIIFATESGLPYFVAQASILLGSAVSRQGRHEEGITKMRDGLAAQRATGGQGLLQYWLALQLEGLIETGEFEEASTVLAEALTIRAKHGDRYWEEEVYRLNGELLLAQTQRTPKARGTQQRTVIETEAEACFRHAIEIAREQNTKSLELRAVTSLGRLLQKQGKKDEARRMLAEIYGWFTEGFDTADLKDAKTLLEEL
jgi:class 3 adenylate cyclase/predicted ATPase